MAYLRSFSGYADAQAPCDDVYYWTFYLDFVENAKLQLPVANTAFRFVFEGQDLNVNASNDDDKCVTLVFDEEDDIGELTVTVSQVVGGVELSDEAKGEEAAGLEGNRWASWPELTAPWNLTVLVRDRRPQGIALAPIPLAARFELKTDQVYPIDLGADGRYVEDDDLQLSTNVKVKVDPAALPDLVADRCRVEVQKVFLGGHAAAENNGIDNVAEVTLNVKEPGTRVTVTVLLAFEQVLIVGEGTGWGYAEALAQKYLSPAPGGRGRKWIFASQYDCTDPGVGGVWNDNLFAYRAPRTAAAVEARERGRFDVTVPADWNAVSGTHGLFDVTIFNNPHPGYGLHLCMVFGLTAGGGLRYKNGKYVSVHTVGFARAEVADPAEAGCLTPAQIQNFRSRADNGTAAVQRDYVRVYLAYACDFAGAALYDFENDTPVSINAAFQYEGGGALVQGNFAAETTHYRSRTDSRGLLEHVLRGYIDNGPAAVRGGGKLFIHGSEHLAAFMDDKDHLGRWEDNPTYFANYDTNHTASTFHPSHFAKTDFVPRKPPLENAKVYEWVR